MNNLGMYRVKLVKEYELEYRVGDESLSSPKTVRNILISGIGLHNETVESFIALFVDTKNKIVGVHRISTGLANQAIIDPAEVMRAALLHSAQGVFLAHNHPSGNLSPSDEDIKTTNRLQEAGKLLGIDIIDHLIVGDGVNYKSLKSEGLM